MPIRLPAVIERSVARAVLGLPPSILQRLVGPPCISPDGLRLDSQLQALLWLIRQMKVPPVHEGGVAHARKAMDRSAPTLEERPSRDVGAYERTIPGAAGPLRTRIYVPSAARSQGLAPGLVFFHGGGWVSGSIDSHDGVCRALAGKSGTILVSVEYRLAPEHPFPAAIDDAIASTRWVLENASSLGIDPAAVAVGGDSAGGNLAALTALALRDDTRRLAFQLLIYPATDLTRSLPSHALFPNSFFLSKAAGDWYLGHYLPDGAVATDPHASPLLARDLSRLPPALVMTAGFDPLRDEGRGYAEKMRAAGVEVEHVCSEGSMHGFLHLGGVIRESARLIDVAAQRLKTGLTIPLKAAAA